MIMGVIVVTALINRLRGWESGYERFHSKYLCAIYLGALWGAYAGDGWIGLMVAAGYALWAVRGWGDYMDFSSRANTEIGWLDAVAHTLHQPWRDGVSMALRGLYVWPLFVAIGLYQLSVLPALIGCGALLQGLFYYAGNRLWPDMSGRATVLAEWLMGAWLGVLLMMAIA